MDAAAIGGRLHVAAAQALGRAGGVAGYNYRGLHRCSALAVADGETVIFADAPSPSLLKQLLKVDAGAAE